MRIEWSVEEIKTIIDTLDQASGLMKDVTQQMKKRGIVEAPLELGTVAYHVDLLCKNLLTRQKMSIQIGLDEAERIRRHPEIKALAVGGRPGRQKNKRDAEKHTSKLKAWTKEIEISRQRMFK